MTETVWVEKYRPKSLTQVVNQKEIVERLKKFVENKSLPHLIFAGPAGVGKTTCAHALVRDLFGEYYSKDAFQELNASDERGIDTIRTSIKTFANKKSLSGIPFKILILDESDNMTSAAQQALRRTMEKYTKSTRFILICNYSSKIIEPIQSRCAIFRFKPLKNEDLSKRIKQICKKEKIQIENSGIEAIIYVSGGDLRKAVNTLQAGSSLDQNLTEHLIYQVTGKARPEEIQQMIQLALDKKFLKSKEIGIHCHNQQQLAYANTIEGIIKDVNYLDATLYGIGRAAGNCPLELLIGFLKNPKYDIRPILEVIGNTIIPIRETSQCGYHIPYMVSGLLNLHPGESIELMSLPEDDPEKIDFVKFYEKLSQGKKN